MAFSSFPYQQPSSGWGNLPKPKTSNLDPAQFGTPQQGAAQAPQQTPAPSAPAQPQQGAQKPSTPDPMAAWGQPQQGAQQGTPSAFQSWYAGQQQAPAQSRVNPSQVPATPPNVGYFQQYIQGQNAQQDPGNFQVFGIPGMQQALDMKAPNSGFNWGGGYQQGTGGASAQESGQLPGGKPGGGWAETASGGVLKDGTVQPTGNSHDLQSSAIGQALMDAIYGSANYGINSDTLNANMAAVQKDADKAKIAQNQLLGARGFGASGVAAADLGGIQSAADAKKADIAYQNAVDSLHERDKMILGLGGMSLQDYQLSSALENQKEADKWTALNNVLAMLGGDKAKPGALADILGAALGGDQGQVWHDISKGLTVDAGGNIIGFTPQPGNGLPTGGGGAGNAGSPPAPGGGQPTNPLAKPPTPKVEDMNAALQAAGINGTFYPQGEPKLNETTGQWEMTGFGDNNGKPTLYVFTYDSNTGTWKPTTAQPAT